MKSSWRGWLLAILHLALVASLAGKYLVDRHTLPRGWVRAEPYDPELPIRGRYVQLRIGTRLADKLRPSDSPKGPVHFYSWQIESARLVLDRDGLILKPAASGESFWVRVIDGRYFLNEPVVYFIPEKVADPSQRAVGEELLGRGERAAPGTAAPDPPRSPPGRCAHPSPPRLSGSILSRL